MEMTSASISAVVEAEAAEAVVVEDEPKPKRRRVKGYDQDTRPREIENLTKGVLTSRKVWISCSGTTRHFFLLLFILVSAILQVLCCTDTMYFRACSVIRCLTRRIPPLQELSGSYF
jgi:hypothetical protein